MGQALHYIPIPPSSSFYARLRSERAFAAVMASLHDYRGGVFDFQSLPEDERVEAIEDLIKRKEGELGPPDQARRHVNAFLSEVDRLGLAHPDIEHRMLYLEGSGDKAIKEQVSRELARTGRIPGLQSLAFMDRLLYGDEPLTSRDTYEFLHLVPADLVAQAAEMLQEIDQDDLFLDDDNYREDFQDWRELYLEAAARGEAIVVAISP